MAYFYIRNNGSFVGTGTGTVSSATMRVGAWDVDPANSLESIDTYLALLPVAGDVAIIADDHNHTYATATVLRISRTSGNFEYYSVNAANQEQYKKGAKESCTTGQFEVGESVFNGCPFVMGVSFEAINGHLKTYAYPATWSFTDSDLTASGDIIMPSSTTVSINNCNLSCTELSTGTVSAEMRGGSLSCSGSTMIFTTGSFRLFDVDLSGCAVNIGLVNGSAYQSAGLVELHRCKMPIAWRFQDNIGTYPWAKHVEGTSCDNGNGYHYFFSNSHACGSVDESTSVYLNYSYDGTNKASALMLAGVKVSRAQRSRHKLCELPAQNLSITDKTYRVNLLLDTATKATLSDSEFFVEVSHNDNTDLALGKLVSSRNTDVFSGATELTSSDETWLGALPATYKAYRVDITLSAASLTNVTNGNVVVYVNLAAANTDVYVCPAVQIGV